MVARVSWLVCILPGVLAASLAPGLRADGLRPPDWKRGQRWTLSVEYEIAGGRVAPGASSPGEPAPRAFSAPAIWLFEVAEVKDEVPGAMRRVRIKARRSGKAESQLTLELVGQPGKDGKLAAVAMETLEFAEGSGKIFRDFRNMSVEPAPILVMGAAVPLCFPFLDSSLVPAGKTEARSRHSITEMVGELPYAMDIEQHLYSGPAAESLALDMGVASRGRKVWVVDLHRRSDGAWARQLWIEGEPWPSRVFTTSMQSTLIGKGVGG